MRDRFVANMADSDKDRLYEIVYYWGARFRWLQSCRAFGLSALYLWPGYPKRPGVVRTFSWDELDAGCVPEVDAIVPLAGKAHDTKNQAAAEVYFKVMGYWPVVLSGIYNMGDDEALSINELIEDVWCLGKEGAYLEYPSRIDEWRC